MSLAGDVFQVLRKFRDENRSFDMIILDPPKFAPTAAHADKATRAYKDINLLAFKLLRPGGMLVTFSCSGGVDAGLFQKIIAGSALDARVDAQLIDRLIEVAESDPQIGVLGPKTYSDDGSGTIQCAGGNITYTQNVCSHRGLGEIDRGQYEEIEDVDYFPGFGFMARATVFEKLNFVDETFYGYGHEDTDFCVRAKRLGYRVVYVPTAVMWHQGSATIGDYSPRKKYLEAVNSVYFVRKYGKGTDRLKYAFFAGFGLIYALVAQSFRGNHTAVVAKARGLCAGLRKPI